MWCSLRAAVTFLDQCRYLLLELFNWYSDVFKLVVCIIFWHHLYVSWQSAINITYTFFYHLWLFFIFMTIVTSSKMLHIQFSLFFIGSFFANLVIRCHSNSLYFGFDTGFVHLFWLIPNRSKKMFHLYTFYVLKFKELLLMHLNNPRSTFSIFKSSWFPYSGWYSNDKIFSMCSLCSSLSHGKALQRESSWAIKSQWFLQFQFIIKWFLPVFCLYMFTCLVLQNNDSKKYYP